MDIEKKLSITIPITLKEFYKKYNGSDIRLCVFDIGKVGYEVNKFIWLKSRNHLFESIIENDRMDGFIPNEYIPLAKDCFGDCYYINNKDEKIYFISSGDIENPVKIADSLDDFIEILNSSREE